MSQLGDNKYCHAPPSTAEETTMAGVAEVNEFPGPMEGPVGEESSASSVFALVGEPASLTVDRVVPSTLFLLPLVAAAFLLILRLRLATSADSLLRARSASASPSPLRPCNILAARSATSSLSETWPSCREELSFSWVTELGAS